MKLYRFLFEQFTNYFGKPFALATSTEGTYSKFVLYDTSKYPNDYIAAFVKTKENKTECPMALQISNSVRGENYPGAGEVIYKIASSVAGKPITSDRQVSTKPEAQNLWKKIESGSGFEHIKLDNWLWNDDYETKTYAHNINKSNNTAEPSLNPSTKETEDDCILPGDSISKDNPNLKPSIEILGTPDAHKASVDTSELIQNHNEMVKAGKVDTAKIFTDAAKLFNRRYGD